MSYQIEKILSNPLSWDEYADFLARFVADGEQEDPKREDANPETWMTRFCWWWNENPFCEEESHRGFVLRDGTGEVVGFHGLIPRDYRRGEVIIPGLIATTFFVRKAHREAALGVFMKVQRLGKRFLIVDGTPSPEMCAILDRFRYQARNLASVSIYALPSNGKDLRRWAIRTVRLLQQPAAEELEGRWISDPGEVGEIASTSDESVRRMVTRESLQWQLKCGSLTKHFLGWENGAGVLSAWLIAEEYWRAGFCFLQVVDFGGKDEESVSAMVSRLLQTPRLDVLPAQADMLFWLDLDGEEPPLATPLKRTSSRPFYYQLPPELSDCGKACRLAEGDSVLI